MLTHTHLIRQQIVEMEVLAEVSYVNLKNKVSNILIQTVYPKLGIICDKYSLAYKHRNISKLKIELGRINISDLEHSLIETLPKKFEDALLAALNSTEFQEENIIKEGYTEKGETAVNLEIVEYFLKTGKLIWYYTHNKKVIGSNIPSKLLLEAARKFPVKIIDLLSSANIGVWTTIIAKYTDQELFSLAQTLLNKDRTDFMTLCSDLQKILFHSADFQLPYNRLRHHYLAFILLFVLKINKNKNYSITDFIECALSYLTLVFQNTKQFGYNRNYTDGFKAEVAKYTLREYSKELKNSPVCVLPVLQELVFRQYALRDGDVARFQNQSYCSLEDKLEHSLKYTKIFKQRAISNFRVKAHIYSNNLKNGHLGLDQTLLHGLRSQGAFQPYITPDLIRNLLNDQTKEIRKSCQDDKLGSSFTGSILPISQEPPSKRKGGYLHIDNIFQSGSPTILEEQLLKDRQYKQSKATLQRYVTYNIVNFDKNNKAENKSESLNKYTELFLLLSEITKILKELLALFFTAKDKSYVYRILKMLKKHNIISIIRPNALALLLKLLSKFILSLKQQERSLDLLDIPEGRDMLHFAALKKNIKLLSAQYGNLQTWHEKSLTENKNDGFIKESQDYNTDYETAECLLNTIPQTRSIEVMDETIYINNAGLILYWPYLKELFIKLKFLDQNHKYFINKKTNIYAALLLNSLIQDNDTREYEFALNKLLCGLPLKTILPIAAEIKSFELKECHNLSSRLISNWGALGATNPSNFRKNFILRFGAIKYQDDNMLLHVEKKIQDILLNKLPWPINVIKLPWMPKPLIIDW